MVRDKYTKLPNGLKTFNKIVTKFTTSTSAPDETFDIDAGFDMGDAHIQTGANGAIVWVCKDPTADAAIWTVFAGEGVDASIITHHGKVDQAGGVLKGQVAYITGGSGAFKPTFALADRGGHDSSHVAGLFKESKGNNQDVEVLEFGPLVGTEDEPLDTSAHAIGTRLHLSTNGNWIGETVDGGGSHLALGRATRSHATEGVINVTPAGYVHNIRAWINGNIEFGAGDDAGATGFIFSNLSAAQVAYIDSLGSATFEDVTFKDPNDADFTARDLARHQLQTMNELATTEFTTTSGTAAGVRTITLTQPDSEKHEFIISNKRLEQPDQVAMTKVHTGLNGTDASPNEIYTYVKNNGSDQPELTASNANPHIAPTLHVDGVYEIVGSVSGSTSNVYASNYTRPHGDALLERVLDRLKEQGNVYLSGMDITATADRFAITSGSVRHVISNASIPALDINRLAAVDTQFTIEDDDTYVTYDDFRIDEYYDGVAVLNTHHVKCRVGVVINNPELTSARIHIIPQDGAQVYVTPAQAWNDLNGMARTVPRNNIVKYAFTPIADIVIKNTAGTFTLIAHPDSGLFYRDIRK